MQSVTIYGLIDPRDGAIHYIGKTISPAARYSAHLSGVGYTAKHFWITTLRTQNLKPVMVVLEETTEEHWAERERHWIKYGREQRWPLTNIAAGGPYKPSWSDDPMFFFLPKRLHDWYRELKNADKTQLREICVGAVYAPVKAWFDKEIDPATAYHRMMIEAVRAVVDWRLCNATSCDA